MPAEDQTQPSAARSSTQARELLALIGEYTAEVAAFGQSLSPGASDDDLEARQRRLDDLRRRIAVLREQALGKRLT